jgi:DNA-binding winged helix-turn-helix (wHTH) protein
VDNHIAKLRQKIERTTADPEYFITIHRIGYKFLGRLYRDGVQVADVECAFVKRTPATACRSRLGVRTRVVP